MKLRKVWLSLLLALAMVVTMLPAVAFAGEDAGYGIVLYDEDDDSCSKALAEIGNGSYYYASVEDEFGYSVDGCTYVWSSADESIVTVAAYDSGEDESEYESEGIEVNPVTSKEVMITGVAQGTTQINVTATFTDDKNQSITVKDSFPVYVLNSFLELENIDPTKAESMAVGQTKAVNTNVKDGLFVFKPTKTAHYVFYSQGSGDQDYDPEPMIDASDNSWDTDDYTYWSDDVDGPENRNFEVCFLAFAGKTYYLQAINYYGKSQFTVGLKLGTNEQAEEVVAKANSYNASNYTPASYNAMVSAKQYLENLLKDKNATPAQIKDATNALNNAINNLQPAATVVTVNVKTVNATAIANAIASAGGTNDSVTKIILGSKVKKISKGAFKPYAKVTDLEIKTKKLTKKSVKGSLKGSQVKKIKVNVAKKAKTNKKYKKKYKKIFTKKNAGKKVSVK